MMGYCFICGRTRVMDAIEDGPPQACRTCRGRYPASLIKACGDPFQYEMGLTNGQVVAFDSAGICGAFVHLFGAVIVSPVRSLRDTEARGLDVALGRIVWCRDVPS